MKKNILVVSQYFWPENFRINDIVEHLVKKGHNVNVLTGKPNYPGGKLYPDFVSNPERFLNYFGARVFRVPILTRSKGNRINLILNYFSFVLSACVVGHFKTRSSKFDVIFVFQPSPITAALPALYLARIFKCRVCIWCLDLWPETLALVDNPLGTLGYRIANFISRKVYRSCDLVMAQSFKMTELLRGRTIDDSRVEYLPNWAQEVPKPAHDIHDYNIPSLKRDDEFFTVVFTGALGVSQDIGSVIDAMALVNNKDRMIRLVLVGDGRNRKTLQNQVERHNLWGVVTFVDYQPANFLQKIHDCADAFLVSLKPGYAFELTVPGKLQSYMLAGKPILGMVSGEAANLILSSGSGLVCEAGDSNGLAKNILDMSQYSDKKLNTMGRRARVYANKHFNKSEILSRMEQLILG